MYNGYQFIFTTEYGLVTLPITPSTLNISNGSKNSVVTLINEGEINILKSPSLTEITFEARFPMKKYPYSSTPLNFESYMDIFTELKEKKKPFYFTVVRQSGGAYTWHTNFQMSLEDLETMEDAEEGTDVIVAFKLKQYKPYGVKFLKTQDNKKTTTSTANTIRSTTGKKATTDYTVKKGDTLWTKAKKFYGDAKKWTLIYQANKTTIERAAKDHGKLSSSNGHWIYPGTKLVIPEDTDKK